MGKLKCTEPFYRKTNVNAQRSRFDYYYYDNTYRAELFERIRRPAKTRYIKPTQSFVSLGVRKIRARPTRV